jgi:hypothetical protein
MKIQSTLFCGERNNENIAQKIGETIGWSNNERWSFVTGFGREVGSEVNKPNAVDEIHQLTPSATSVNDDSRK